MWYVVLLTNFWCMSYVPMLLSVVDILYFYWYLPIVVLKNRQISSIGIIFKEDGVSELCGEKVEGQKETFQLYNDCAFRIDVHARVDKWRYRNYTREQCPKDFYYYKDGFKRQKIVEGNNS